MNYTEKHRKEIRKILQELKESIRETLDFALDHIDSIQMDSYFHAEEHCERILKGLIRLEEEFEGEFTRDKLKQFETRLFFLEDRFEEIEAELRQRPRRRRRPRMGLLDFIRLTQEEQRISAGGSEIQSHSEAFALFNLDPGAPLKTVTATFRKMAKELHPDSRGGDRSKEPQLRKLIAAYQYVKEYYASE